MVKQPPHKSGSLKQKNKPFKGKSKKKSKNDAKGRSLTQKSGPKSSIGMSKAGRKNARAQRKKMKKSEVLNDLIRHGIASAGAEDGQVHINRNIPRSFLVVALSPTADPLEFVEAIAKASSVISRNETTITVATDAQSLTFCHPSRSLFAVLDGAKATDGIIFLIRAGETVDQVGDELLTGIRSQGMANVVGCIQENEQEMMSEKEKLESNKFISRIYQTELGPTRIKPSFVSSNDDLSRLIRSLTSMKCKEMSWRDRPYMLSLDTHYDEASETLTIHGYLKGVFPISANDLIVVPNLGTFNISTIHVNSGAGWIFREQSDPGVREMLHVFHEEDELIDAESMKYEAADPRMKSVVYVKKPMGVSDTQEAWMEDEIQVIGEEAAENDVEMGAGLLDEDESDNETGTVLEDDSDDREERRREKIEQTKLSRDAEIEKRRTDILNDIEFPDEVDTPLDIPARERFFRYRGLKSFTRSPWDPNENLPPHYGKLFSFQNIKKAKEEAEAEARKKTAGRPGELLRIAIEGVPASIMSQVEAGHPIVACGLLKYEQYYTAMHFSVRSMQSRYTDRPSGQAAGDDEPLLAIKSRTPVTLQCGFRRITARPMFSEECLHTNKHRYQRWFTSSSVVSSTNSVATIVGQVSFAPQPVLLFHAADESSAKLAACPSGLVAAAGSIHSIDPSRIVVKRCTLSGYPIRVHKRSAVIRYMFFDPLDVKWFKPVTLHSKLGRKGFILGPVGTHGRMKIRVDGLLKSDDTFCMSLYKRVFPKFDSYPESVGVAIDESGVESRPGDTFGDGDDDGGALKMEM